MSRPDEKGNKPRPGDWGSAAVDPEPGSKPAAAEETVTVDPAPAKSK